MEENRVSLYHLEVTSPFDQGTGKPVKVANYNLEIIVDIPSPGMKPLRIANYTLEVIQAFVPESTTVEVIPPYYFTGSIEDDTGPVEREVISYNRATYNFMDTSLSDPTSGSFFLDSTTSGICFLVALDDDDEGVDYNHLVAAIVQPAVFDDYGFSTLNPGKSAKDIKDYNPAATFDGLYWIQPATYIEPIQVYCDMTTQGGGWTMCARWDRDFATDWESCLPSDAMRSNINVVDMVLTKAEGAFFAATINVIPIITDGATHFMHRSVDLTDRYWKHTYFSDIYQVIRDAPENIFDAAYDTNDLDAVLGTLTSKSSTARTLWYDHAFDILSSYNLNNASYNYCLSGGEGDAMFSIGSRHGATYASHPSSDTVTSDDHVYWGFYGKDNTVPDGFTYTYPPLVGTHKSPTYPPACRFNFMFIR